MGQKFPDGPFAGHCFHPEGQGKSWHDWKRVLNISFGRSPDTAASNGHLPTIGVTGRHLRDIARDCWSALTVGDRPPTLFNYGGTLAQIRRDDGRIRIEPVSAAALKGRLDRAANFIKRSNDKNGLSPARPPADVVEDMLALELPLPNLSGISGAPVFDEKWNLVDSPGYQPLTRLFFDQGGCGVPRVPETPSGEDVRRARSLLLDEWLGDFPFVEESSRSHAVAALLSHVLRNRIDGPVPLVAVDAPTAGSGKSLLVESIGLIATGASPAAMSLPRKDDELRKQITSVLLGGTPIVLLDNITHTLESGVLAAALTSRNWSDRLLGKSETVSVPNNCLWIATGNNLDFGSELIRRTVWIRLDPKVDRPLGAHRLQARSAWRLGCREPRSAALGAVRSGQTLARRWQAWLAGAPARLVRVLVPHPWRHPRLRRLARLPREPRRTLPPRRPGVGGVARLPPSLVVAP